MYEYSHGGNAVFEDGSHTIIDLSANINPLGMPRNIRDAIINEIPNSNRYPDSYSEELREKIASFECVKPDWIFCGNGASDIIFRLPRAAQAKKVMVTAPSFSDYERAARSYGSEIIRYTLPAENDFMMDRRFVEAVKKEKPDFVFIGNPNNPTGKLTESGLIEEILWYCQETGAWVLIDECFINFSEREEEYTGKIFLEQYSNLIILKAFTKLFALPGIRLGYALNARKALIENLYYHGPDWPVSNLAQAAGIAALEETECFIKQTIEYVSTERNIMEAAMTQLGCKVYESNANYIFFQMEPFDLRKELDRKGIRIRSCGNYYGLDNSYYRIAVSTKENNKKVLTAIKEILKEYREIQ